MSERSWWLGVGAIIVTLGLGTCSTNGRFDDVTGRFNDVNGRFSDVHIRIDDVRSDMNRRFDAMQSDMNRRFDDVQADIRELRALIIDATGTRPDPAN